MRRAVLLLLCSPLLSTGLRPAAAVICAVDAVPAATLLLPYFEVDLGNPAGSDTLFSVNNASASAVLVHLVIWSDLSVPVLDFNLYLTGYDVQTINLRDILVSGNLPRTAPAGEDPEDTISPRGHFSMDLDFPNCQGVLPPPALPAAFIDHLQAALTGQPSEFFGLNCAGQPMGDHVARGYITADTVNNCTLRFPGDVGYFAAGGLGDATNQNVLWGDYVLMRPQAGLVAGGTLVHVEADAANPRTSTAGLYTFYGRYDNWTAIDNREPLATTFGTRFTNAGAAATTTLAVWRDSKLSQGPFSCPAAAGSRPPWLPLGEEEIVIFDEQEHAAVPQSFPFSPQPPSASLLPFPAEAQLVEVGGAALPVPYQFGWLLLDLNTLVVAAGGEPPVDPGAAQAFVTAFDQRGGGFAVGIEAVRFDSACAASHAGVCFGLPPPLPLTLSPNAGSPGGGAFVSISGSGFVPGEDVVSFGSSPATIESISSTDLLVLEPPFTGTFPLGPCLGPGGESGTMELPAKVQVVVTDTLTGCSGTAAGSFSYFPADPTCHLAIPPPVASFTVSVPTGSDTVTFQDTSTGLPTAWTWSFGDGATSLLENPVHTYALAGDYLVTLTASNPAGSNSVTGLIVVPGP